jgi:hypothetical protein
MIVLALLLALLPQLDVQEYERSCSSSLLARDTSEAGVRAWREKNQRVWQALQRDKDEDTLQLVGRWPFGGALRVRPSWNFASDSIVYMSDGSGIRVLKASDPRRPRMIGQLNCRGILDGQMENGTGFVSRDTFLYVAYMRTRGLQVFSVADPARPYELGDLPLTGDPTGVALKDSFAIVVGWDSFFRVINIANPRSPREVASLFLPDFGLGVDIKGNCAFVGCAHAGLVSVDISNPLNPQQRGQVGGFTGIWVVCDTTRPLAYVAGGAGGLHIINIADPSSLVKISTLATTPTIDVFKADTFVYLTGSTAYQSNFYVVSVADSTHPRLLGQSLADGWSYSACALSPFSWGYACDGWEGLHVISLANPASPVVDTAMYGAWGGEDLAVQDSLVFYASGWAGMKVLSAGTPQNPQEIGCYDTTNIWDEVWAVAVLDSFAYISWFNMQTGFRSVDVSSPAQPRLAGVGPWSNQPAALVVRDTLCFAAEDYNFEVYNIARPRQPVRIGRCDLLDEARGMDIEGDYAYVAKPLQVVDIRDPANPGVVGYAQGNCMGVDVVDTLAYVVSANGFLKVYSVANHTVPPRLIDSVPVTGIGYDVDVWGHFAYVGCYRLEAFDVSDPASPVKVASYNTPDFVWRLYHDSSHVYAACSEGGLCILRACSTGVVEFRPAESGRQSLVLSPSPTTGQVRLRLTGSLGKSRIVSVRDAAGREVMSLAVSASSRGDPLLDLSGLPDGCYFVSCSGRTDIRPAKLVISKGR